MSSTESLGVYWGGFLYNSCSPLEITLNRCSHSCAYCFANLNKPKRSSEPLQAMKLLAEFRQTNAKGKWKRTSYAAYLLRQGYAVTISNRVDPLASSNWFQARPLIEVALAQDVPLNLMTRFGSPSATAELFELLGDRPTPIYSSLPTLSSEIAAKCEPGAPPPEKRLEYLQQAISLGHPVTVGLNPLIPGWIDNPEEIAKTLASIGVWGVWLNKIHLSKAQVERMPQRDKSNLGEHALELAMNSKKSAEMAELYTRVREACEAAKLHIYDTQQGTPSDFFHHEHRLTKRSFPMMQDWVNHCHANYQDGHLLHWQDFRDFFVPRLPKGKWGLRDHINSVANHQSLYGLNIPQSMNYEQLLWHCWKHAETLFCPANVECFAWAGDKVASKRNTWIGVEDAEGNPVLVFKPSGTDGQLFTEEHNL